MRYSLNNVVWYSNKRKNVLLLLKEGPRNLDRIKKSLNENSRSIMPQIKKLLEKRLIVYDGDTYRLTEIGELVVENMQPLLNIMRVIEENKDFWTTRNLSALPPFLFSRLGEIGHYALIEPDLSCMFELPREFRDNLLRSQQVSIFISYIHPQIPSLYSELAQMEVSLSLFMTKQVFESLKSEFVTEAKKMAASDNVEFFVCSEDVLLPTIAVTGRFIYLCFLNVEGRYDHRDIISFDESAVSWCTELIYHYRNQSKRVYFS